MTTIIVGAGPAGLTLATYLPGPVVVVEREATIGGCHRVRRDALGFFGEHGPRVYSGCYVNTRRVLGDIGMPWDTVFTRAAFSPEHIDGKRWYAHLSVWESVVLTLQFIALVFVPDWGRDTTVREMCVRWRFSDASMRYLDQVCRNSDGAGIDRYSLYEFLRGFNDHMLPFYEPRAPLDTTLWTHWHRVLRKRGVDVRLNAPVRRLAFDSTGRVCGVMLKNGQRIAGSRVIFAVPPVALRRIVRHPWLERYATRTEYDEYVNVCYHFPRSMAGKLVEHTGLRSTPWGLVYMDMSKFFQNEQTAVLSVAASRLDVPSPQTGKTLRESSGPELVEEILRQVPVHDAVKKQVVRAVPSSGEEDEAYVATAGTPPMPFEVMPGVYTVGCHNGNSWYAFTSFESAVANALTFLGKECAVPWTLVDIARVVLLLSIVYVSQRMMRS